MRKEPILFAFVACLLIGVVSQDLNVFNGPGNVAVSGVGNVANGKDNLFNGNSNLVNGNVNSVDGDNNDVDGD